MNKNDQRAVNSRTAMVEAGVQALIKNPTASLSDIAAEAGVGRATLYRHFETRERLVQELALSCLEETDVALAEIRAQGLSPLEQIKASIYVLMPMADRFSFLLNLWSIAKTDPKVNEIYFDQLNQLLSLVEAAQQLGELRSDLSPEWIVAVFDSLLISAWWNVHLGRSTMEESIEFFSKTFFGGVQASTTEINGN